MSADNYYLIRPEGSKFVVTMGFASDDEEPEISDRDHRFDTLKEASQYSQGEYAEYGVTIDPSCWDEPEGTLDG